MMSSRILVLSIGLALSGAGVHAQAIGPTPSPHGGAQPSFRIIAPWPSLKIRPPSRPNQLALPWSIDSLTGPLAPTPICPMPVLRPDSANPDSMPVARGGRTEPMPVARASCSNPLALRH